MPRRADSGRQKERALLLLLFALFLFASPLTTWWSSGQYAWFVPYLLWLLVILLGAWLHYRFHRHDL